MCNTWISHLCVCTYMYMYMCIVFACTQSMYKHTRKHVIFVIVYMHVLRRCVLCVQLHVCMYHVSMHLNSSACMHC